MPKPSRSKQAARALALLAGALAAGCDYDCEDLCEDALECAGATEAEAGAEVDEGACTRQCQDTVALAEVTDCDDPYEDYLDCAAETEDACAVSSACDARARAYDACITAYCSGNPDDPACRDLTGT